METFGFYSFFFVPAQLTRSKSTGFFSKSAGNVIPTFKIFWLLNSKF